MDALKAMQLLQQAGHSQHCSHSFDLAVHEVLPLDRMIALSKALSG
jgi:hypothetical protein